uniref:Putative methyltransferase n=1 Tax=viral metagenome TaxID=1070528 RepID=A0A6M3XGP3_9ZZZZ
MLDYIFDMYNKKTRQTGFMKHYLTLFSIVEGLETKNSFEFGAGLSTYVILEALKYTNGKHICCDYRGIKNTYMSNEFLENNQGCLTYLTMDSTTINFENIDVAFDFVLHDGSHLPEIVEIDLLNIIPKMKLNSILVIHDTESVVHNKSLKKPIIDALKNYHYEIVTLSYGYGLTIIRIKEDFNNGEIFTTWVKK